MTRTNQRWVTCPNCGHKHPVELRAKIGEGTLKGRSLKRLNRNYVNLLQVIYNAAYDRFLSVNSVKTLLTARRWKRGDKEKPTGEWNYHTVQQALSMLVGADLVTMHPQANIEEWDEEEQRHVVKEMPGYFMDRVQVLRSEKILRSYMEALDANPDKKTVSYTVAVDDRRSASHRGDPIFYSKRKQAKLGEYN